MMNTNIAFTVLAILAIAIACVYLAAKQYNERKSSRHPAIVNLKALIASCFPDIPPIKLYEGCKSYTLNKDKIFLCLRDRDGQTYDTNILMYVLLHEIAHTLCNEVGHTPQFKQIFDALLQRAIACGIYTPVTIPKDYCNFE